MEQTKAKKLKFLSKQERSAKRKSDRQKALELIKRPGINLQIGNPVEIEVKMVFHTPFCKQFERAVHSCLTHKRVRGEWFELDEKDLFIIENSISNVFQSSEYEKASQE